MEPIAVIRYPSPSVIRSEWIREGLGNLVATRVDNGYQIMQFSTFIDQPVTATVMLIPYHKITRMTNNTDIIITTNTKSGRYLYNSAKSLGFSRIIHYNAGGTNLAVRKVCNSYGTPEVFSADMIATDKNFLLECIRLILYPKMSDINYVNVTRCLAQCSGKHMCHSCTDRDGDVIMRDISAN